MWSLHTSVRYRPLVQLFVLQSLAGQGAPLEGTPVGEDMPPMEDWLREYEAVARSGHAGSAVDFKTQRALRAKMHGRTHPVTLEVFFLATCSHCATFIHESLVPVVEAKLPEVSVTLLPVLKNMDSRESCAATDACSMALAPLCAIKDTLPQPVSADSKALGAASGFLDCIMEFTGYGLYTKEADEYCAEQASMKWSGRHGLAACRKDQVFDIMHSVEYAGSILQAMRRLRDLNYTQPPQMPWVFLNGELMLCADGIDCVKANEPNVEGESLVDAVCNSLEDGSAKERCKGAGEADVIGMIGDRPGGEGEDAELIHMKKFDQCPTCSRGWSPRNQADWSSAMPLFLVAVTMLALVAAAAALGIRIVRSRSGRTLALERLGTVDDAAESTD